MGRWIEVRCRYERQSAGPDKCDGRECGPEEGELHLLARPQELIDPQRKPSLIYDPDVSAHQFTARIEEEGNWNPSATVTSGNRSTAIEEVLEIETELGEERLGIWLGVLDVDSDELHFIAEGVESGVEQRSLRATWDAP